MQKMFIKPDRKRITKIKYTDKEYIPYYDIDKEDFEELVLKLNKNISLSKEENTRYGEYVLAVVESILEGPRFRLKPLDEKEQLRDEIYHEILLQVPTHYKEKRGTIYNYAYRCGYLRAIHFYTDAQKARERFFKNYDNILSMQKQYSQEINDAYEQ